MDPQEQQPRPRSQSPVTKPIFQLHQPVNPPISQPQRTAEPPNNSLVKYAPEPFYGYQDSNFTAFLQHFKIYSKFVPWNDDRKCSALPIFLRGPALMWYDQLKEEQSANWDSLLLAFKEEFSRTAHKWMKRNQIYERKQLYNETVEQFACAIAEMGREIQADDGMMMLLFMQGLREGMREKILPFGPVSFQECKDKAILIESTLPPVKTNNAPWKRNTTYKPAGNKHFSSDTRVHATKSGNDFSAPPKAQIVNTPRGGGSNTNYRDNNYVDNYRANHNPSSNDARGYVLSTIYKPSSQGSYPYNRTQRPNKNFQCYKCGFKGHIQAECRTKAYHPNQKNCVGNS